MLLVISCGHKGAPSGGEVDEVKPTVKNTYPAQYSSIDEGYIEIVFSKPIKSSSVIDKITIYPEVKKTKFKWENAYTLRLYFKSELKEDTNYTVTLDKSITGYHGNKMEKDMSFVFANGELQEMSLSGQFKYEDEEDRGKDVIIQIRDEDSLLIQSSVAVGSIYNIENLNKSRYIFDAFIDKDDDKSYDYAKEPMAHFSAEFAKNIVFDFELAYQDTISPALNSVIALSNTNYKVKFSEPVSSYADLAFFEMDSLNNRTKIPILAKTVIDDDLYLITDSLQAGDFAIIMTDLLDAKGNIAEKDSVSFKGSSHSDEKAPELVSSIPENGDVVSSLNPEFIVSFSEIIYEKDLKISLVSQETDELVKLRLKKGANTHEYVFTPEKNLVNYQSYMLTIEKSTCDTQGNNLKEPIEIKFITILND